METNIYQLKRVLLLLIVTVLSGVLPHSVQGQTGSCTVIQQPCNGDGILETTVSGVTPPVTFQYLDVFQTVHVVSELTDTYVGEYTPGVVVSGSGVLGFFLASGMVQPFNTDYPQTTPEICPNPGSATITINNGLSPDSVRWFDSSQPFPGVYLGTGNPMTLTAGYYNYQTFYNGCYTFGDSAVMIYYNSPIYFNINTTPANCTNGTATVSNITGGTPPYSILWFNGATTPNITGLSQGSYMVKVTDNIGCYRELSFYIQQSVQIPVNMVITHQPTCLQNDGKVMAFGSGGTNPYTYLWSDGQTTQEAVNLVGGTFLDVIVTDQNGCVGQGYTWLTPSTPINVLYSVTPSSCTAPTGSATLSITGGTPPYSVTWNTYPQQTGETVSGLPAGTYHFTVTDAVGCVRTGSVPIPPESVITASIYSGNAICPNNTGYAGVTCFGISPFTYLWNTGATTSSISDLAPGSYNCTITDANGCSVTKYTSVQSIPPFAVGFSSTPASCRYAADGSITALPTGGTPPFSYLWSNGTSANPAVNLTPGTYTVTVTDAQGCHKSYYATVINAGTSDACYCTIEGHVYLDPLEDCNGSAGIEHIQVSLAPFGYTWTDANGHFSFQVPSGSYTLSEVVQYLYPLTPGCPANEPVPYTITASSGCVQTHDFYNSITPLHDAHLVPVNWTYPVPGFTYIQKWYIENDGTVSQPDILLNYYPEPAIMPFVSSPPMTASADFYYNTDPIDLNPGQETEYLVTYTNPIPVNMPLGTVLNFTGIAAYEPPISNWLEDYTPWNNYRNWTATVVGSYDPNSKEVFPQGDGPDGIISVKDSVLDYTVHFQNTGTWYAENVVVTDTLDPDLDWTTLRPGASSHPYTAELSASGVLKFTFANIHLVWESQNEINSNGFVTYSVKQKPDLAIGTEIRNSAAIWFDFNPPIVTDTTLNTIGIHEGTPVKTAKGKVKAYPDPATTELFLDTKEFGKVTSITVFSLTGSAVLNGTPTATPVQKLRVSELSSGLYFVTVVNADGERGTVKFIKN